MHGPTTATIHGHQLTYNLHTATYLMTATMSATLPATHEALR